MTDDFIHGDDEMLVVSYGLMRALTRELDEAVPAERARIRAAVVGLEGQCHSYSGLGCDASPCIENVYRDDVLAIIDEWPSKEAPNE